MLRRTILLGLALALFVAGVVIQGYYRQQRIERFVAGIKARGGSCERAFSGPLEAWCDHWLRTITWKMGFLRGMNPSSVGSVQVKSLTAEELTSLREMKGLQRLTLDQARPTQDFAASLGNLKEFFLL
ncbi:MAG: hypothetical protein U0903_20960 [Planctomycetales bacterium]